MEHHGGNHGRAGGDRESRASAFQGRDPLFEGFLGRIRQPPVDVPGIRQSEPVRRVPGIVEDVGCGLIDRHRPGVRHGIRRLLSRVQL